MISALVKRYWLQLLVLALIGALAFFVNTTATTPSLTETSAIRPLRNSSWRPPPLKTCRPASVMSLHWMPNTPENWLMRKKPLSVCIAMSLLAVSGCKSPPPVQSQRPEPAAWAMEKAQDLQQMLNSIITVYEVESTR